MIDCRSDFDQLEKNFADHLVAAGRPVADDEFVPVQVGIMRDLLNYTRKLQDRLLDIYQVPR
jgi:hypothetical protein